MSHQTGIRATDELKLVFGKCKAKREIRCIKLSIDKEQLKLDETLPISLANSWKSDWSAYIKREFVPKQNPCYILFRLDPISPDDSDDLLAVTGTTNSNSKKTLFPRTLVPAEAAKLSNCNERNNNDNGTLKNSIVENGHGVNDKWLFVSWSPEASSIREKMIYASTKSTLKLEFGGESIFADYFAATFEDLLVDTINKWIERKRHIRDGHIDMNELSLSEQELQQVKMDEAAIVANLAQIMSNSLTSSSKKDVSGGKDTATKDTTGQIGQMPMMKSLPRIEMPISDSAINALFDFKQGKSAYVQLSIDSKNETIQLEKNELAHNFSLSDKTLVRLTPKDHARYHLLSFSHTPRSTPPHDSKDGRNDKQKSIFFIYSIPSSGCPVKERMLYSSCKNWLVHVIETDEKIGISIDRKLETDDPAELTENFLMDQLYPIKAPPMQQTIVKPKGPTKQHNPARRKVM